MPKQTCLKMILLISLLPVMASMQTVRQTTRITGSSEPIKENYFYYSQPNSDVQPDPLSDQPLYIGLRYGPDLPQGFVEISGAAVDELNGIEYAVAHIAKGNEEMLWFEKLTHRNARGMACWEVLDVRPLPRMKANQLLLFGILGCEYNKKYDSEIVAIVDEEKTGLYLTRIRYAWRGNRRTGKLEKISTRKIRCENSGCE
jgi:hypothetical protein